MPVTRERRDAIGSSQRGLRWLACVVLVACGRVGFDPSTPADSCEANLIANADFEAGLAGWSPYGNSTLESVEGRLAGSAVRSCRATDGRADDYGAVFPTGMTNVAVGDHYTLSGWVRVPSAVPQQIGGPRLHVQVAGAGNVDGAGTNVNLDVDWQWLEVDLSVTAAGNILEPSFKSLSAPDALCMEVDDVCMQRL